MVAHSGYKFAFEKLETWQLSRHLSEEIYKITMEFPPEEKFGLVNQMRRAAVSVGSNLAEGVSRTTPMAQANFCTIAYGSLMEVLSQLILCQDLNLIDPATLDAQRIRILELSNKINSLRKTQLNS